MIELFLILSAALNIVFVLYSRLLISILKAREEDVSELADTVFEYITHVKAVHEMEMFYGDQTLSGLIRHGTDMMDKIDSFDFLLRDMIEEQEEGEDES